MTCYTKRDKKTKKKVVVPKNTNLRPGEERKVVQAKQDDDSDYETPFHILDRVRGKGHGKKKGGGKKKKK